jgi:uncharacterized protein YdeI (YjbR/CyaY-like superfamily)
MATRTAGNVLYFRDRQEWREWLEKNYDKASEAWLVFYKKHTGKTGIPYADAVEEALCFGWIDGPLRRIDGEKHMQRFCPRRKGSVWAESNIKRVRRMIRLGKMTKAGMEKFSWHEKTRVPGKIGMPGDLERALKSEGVAWKNFQSFPPSHRKHFLWWVVSSKRPETRKKRISELVKRAAENRRLA